MKRWLLLTVCAFVLTMAIHPARGRDDRLGPDLQALFERRARAILTGDASLLAGMHDLSVVSGRWAQDHEQRKVAYLEAWARARGVRWTDVSVSLTVHELTETRADVTASWRLEYAYGDGARHAFGIGTHHAMELARQDGRLVIRRDWFLDPLEEESVAPAFSHGTCSPPAREAAAPPRTVAAGQYDRAAAAAYADRFCGAAWGCGGAYNRRYRNYGGMGGDCTNFASQVLGDREAGNLPQDGTWFYIPGKGGSRAWVQAPALASYLLWSGRGRRLYRGPYAGAVPVQERLQPGDLVFYEDDGSVEHVSVVTGADPKGVALVNSHSGDRFRVPWDLGWGARTIYWLVQIR